MIGGVSSSSVFQATPLARSGAKSDSSLAGTADSSKSSTDKDLTSPAVQAEVRELKSNDQKIRTHEQAHVSAGGPYAGATQLQFTTGPDGKRYAVAGEVQIDISAERDPSATIRKMETVKRAATAPADPSPQDMRVAQQAQAAEIQARQELTDQSSSGAGTGASKTTAASKATVAYGAAASIGKQSSSVSITA